MSSFTEPLSITEISAKPRQWRVDRPFTYYIGQEGSAYWVRVLPGFVCDGGSIPRCVWWLDSPLGDGCQSYFLHDLMYQAEAGDRAFCDNILAESLSILPLGWTRRNIIYQQVRMWGWMAWNAHTPETIRAARMFSEFNLPPGSGVKPA